MMPNAEQNEPVLIVEPFGEQDIHISDGQTMCHTDHFEIVIGPGECFGGHDYNEWREIATTTGNVSSDWLNV